jgi:hypothetical protein
MTPGERLEAPVSRRVSGWTRHLDLAILVAASCVAILCYVHMHTHLGPSAAPTLELFRESHRTPLAGSDYRWWTWWDQSAYLQAALAWAHGVLDPAYHWYLPGYPLLGAPFVRITPARPFLVPDLACLVGSLWLFASLAARLMGGVRHGRAIGAMVFIATAVLPQKALWSWVAPWTTTPEALCMFACLLAASRFTASLRPLDAFLAALAGVATAGFRPADSAALVAASGAVMAWTLVRRWPGWRRVFHIAAAALAGAMIPAVVFGAAHLAVFGIAPSEYLTLSGMLGFEWRLLPLRWVTLMIDPKPLFPEGRGVAAVFPWIAPGAAGMAACLVTPLSVPRRLHVLVAGATLLDCAVFLAYRDLHPTGLWRFGNFHYFKWTLPVFGLYALLLLRAAFAARPSRLPALAAAACAILGLFMWRVELTDPVPLPPVGGARDLILPSGLSRINDALLAKASGDPSALYGGGSYLSIGDRTFESLYDFKVFLRADSLMVVPLRPMPAAASTLHLAPGATLDAAVAPILARQTLVWGLPCWVMPSRASCRTWFPFPPAPLPLGEAVALGSTGRAEEYLVAGWSVPEPNGRWTDGHRATLRFGVPPLRPDESPAVEITAHGYMPRRGAPIRVTAVANGKPVAKWRFGPDAPGTVRASIPREAVGPDGAVTLDLVITNPRQPWLDAGAADVRDLGLHVEAIKLTATPKP